MIAEQKKFEMDEELFFYMDILKDDFNEVQQKDLISQPSSIISNEQSQTLTESEKQDQDSNSISEEPKKLNKGRWKPEEHNRFLEALRLYGKNWDKITSHIGTRDAAHTRSHAQKFFAKLTKYFKGIDLDQIGHIDDAEYYYNILQKKKAKKY